MTLHFELMERVEQAYGNRLDAFPEMKQDALILSFDGGLKMELRYAGPAEYAIQWSWGEAMLRLDTAPVHPQLETFPNHLHDAAGRVLPDPLTRAGDEPWDNLRRVIEAVLADPLLQDPTGA